MKEMTVEELVGYINNSRNQVSVSAKDEVEVMKAMLNDPTYKVDVYSRTGYTQECPYEQARTMISNIIQDTTGMSSREAKALSENYEFDNRNARIMVDLHKEYTDTYLETGRKLSLFKNEDSNVSISRISKNGRGGIRAYCPTPSWIKDKKE